MAIVQAGRWSPGIGDPTVIGWVTVVAYAAAAVLCAVCAAREPPQEKGARFWRVVSVLMLLLGINKQLDLQTWFTQTGRDMAMSEGWYPNRYYVQMGFIALLAIAGLLSQVWLYFVLRDHGTEVRCAALGLVFLTVFIVMRATSFHHVDHLIHVELAGLKVNWIMELSGIGCIAAAAGVRWRRLRRAAGASR